MTSPEAVLFPVSLSLSISPEEADAGATLTLKAVAECPEEYDLSGDQISFHDAAGREIGSASLAALEGTISAQRSPSPPRPSSANTDTVPCWCPPQAKAFAHAGARAEARCTVKPDDIHINAWGIPTAIVAGEAFNFHVGIKSSSGSKLDGGAFDVRDENGAIVASGKLGDAVWPGTSALYYAEVQATAPQDIGARSWMVEFIGSNSGIAHSPGSLSIPVRTVAAPDNEITIEVVDRESGEHLKGINIIMHPYRATTGQNGVARMKVVADHYLLHASGMRRVPYRDHIDATRPVKLRLLMAVEQPQFDYAAPTPQIPSIAQVLE